MKVIIKMASKRKTTLSRLGWFIVLWLGGVAAVLTFGFIIKLVLGV